MSDSLWPYGLQPTRLLCPWDSPGKNTGVGSHFLLQGIFLTQGSNLGLLYCRQILPCLSHQGRPEKLEAAFFGSWPFPPSSKHIISISAFAIASTFFSDLWLLWAYLDNPGLFSHFKILNQICLWCLLPYRGFPGSSEDKVSACNAGDPGSIPGSERWHPWRRKWHPTTVLLPGKSHGRRSLVSYSPWGCKELDTTEQLHFLFLPYKVINLQA